MTAPETPRCGHVAIVGRPNVGKSTILNRLLGQHLSITSKKPQTTRTRVIGIRTEGAVQIVFVDTPGWEGQPRSGINRSMNREVVSGMTGVDAIVFVTDARSWEPADDRILADVAALEVPVVLVMNKVDLLADKSVLLPRIAEVSSTGDFAAVVPMSAKTWDNGSALVREISALIPEGEHEHPEDEVTTQSARFFAAEILREKLMRYLGDEVPYSSSVIIDQFVNDGRETQIAATIWVEREGQKAIVIGSGGATLKQIASAARQDMEQMLGGKVFLQTWVKVRQNWRNDVQALRQLGYDL